MEQVISILQNEKKQADALSIDCGVSLHNLRKEISNFPNNSESDEYKELFSHILHLESINFVQGFHFKEITFIINWFKDKQCVDLVAIENYIERIDENIQTLNVKINQLTTNHFKIDFMKKNLEKSISEFNEIKNRMNKLITDVKENKLND